MASASQPPALDPAQPPSPLAASASPPTSTTTSTVTTANQASTTSPPLAASTAGSSLSSPQSPPGPANALHHHHHHHPYAPSNLSSTLPSTSPSSQRQVAEARQAVLASIGNMLDSSLRDRASVLHSNAAAIAKQERDVAKATEALRKENDKLAKVAGDAAKKVKELGNVQNWAEVLESDFLAIEETIRLVREGSEGSWRTGSGGSWSGSEAGSEAEGDGDGDVRMDDGQGEEGGGEPRAAKADKGKGKATELDGDDAMDVDGGRNAYGRSDPRTGDLAAGDMATVVVPAAHVPAVENVGRGAPSIRVPGVEPSQTSTTSLEDELRTAMDLDIGGIA